MLKPTTPNKVDRLRTLLVDHPDRQFTEYVLHGLERGFSVGYTLPLQNTSSPNLPSASQHPDFVSTSLQEACRRGETAGPFDTKPFPTMYISGVGVVPKKSGKLRLIHHLSSPSGRSVNDGIPKADFSLHYVTIDNAISAILAAGRGCYLSKVDIKSAFRICPVRPADWPLLGIHWQGKYYFERALPFGLRSSPAIFNSVADAVEWILINKFSITALLHYLDDYLNVAGLSLPVATKQLSIILDVFRFLGIPIATDKTLGPSQVLPFLGVELDTVLFEARLPADKLREIKDLLQQLLGANHTTYGFLETFLGKLSFASRVVVPGRTFTRRLWDLKRRYHKAKAHYRVKISAECRHDLLWWQVLLDQWNGRSFFLNAGNTSATDLGIYTDASGLGWGAYFGQQHRWTYGEWEKAEDEYSIEYKELYAIVAACAAWGGNWQRLRVVFHCDNRSVVDAIAAGSSRSPPVMHLLRVLFMLCSLHCFHVTAVHVAGVANPIADALSRLRLQEFRRLAPSARISPDQVPPFPWEDNYLKTCAATRA